MTRSTSGEMLFGSRQQRIHEMIQQVGGYWPPIAGIARLLEELGELAELLSLEGTAIGGSPVAEELADIWIISTCTANQYQIPLRRPLGLENAIGSAKDLLLELWTHAGQVARIVNYYDGPKSPRSLDRWPTLTDEIHRLHSALVRLSEHYGISLFAEVDAKIARTPARDAGRFRRSFDPSTAEALSAFAAVQASTACLFARRARLWGAPLWEPAHAFGRNAERIAPYLAKFAKASREGLDGFVIAVPEIAGMSDMVDLGTWFNSLLRTLANMDVVPNASFDVEIDRPGWQFTFGGVRMFISVFSDIYGENHPRSAQQGTFVLFQPEQSFAEHRIGSGHIESAQIKRRVRSEFAARGIWYPLATIDRRIEARIYLLPLDQDAPEVEWWGYPLFT